MSEVQREWLLAAVTLHTDGATLGCTKPDFPSSMRALQKAQGERKRLVHFGANKIEIYA